MNAVSLCTFKIVSDLQNLVHSLGLKGFIVGKTVGTSKMKKIRVETIPNVLDGCK